MPAEELAHVARAASSPPLWLSVATKLTIAVDSSPESMMTVGIPARAASSTGRTSARAVERREHDAGDALRDEALDDLDLLLAVVLAERALPDDGVDPCARSSRAALTAPAWMLFQNSWVVPLG